MGQGICTQEEEADQFVISLLSWFFCDT